MRTGSEKQIGRQQALIPLEPGSFDGRAVNCAEVEIAFVYAGPDNCSALHLRLFRRLCQPGFTVFSGFFRVFQRFLGFSGRQVHFLVPFRLKQGFTRRVGEGSGWGFGGGCKGGVEQSNERRGEAEGGGDAGGELRCQCVGGEEGGGDAPAALEEEVEGEGDGGIGGGREAFRGPGERVPIFDGEDVAESAGGEQAAVGGVVIDEIAADGKELVGGGHEDARGNGDLGGVETEVEACAGGLGHAGPAPPGGEVGFVGELVGAEAGVAKDAEHDFMRRADELRGEVGEGVVDLFDEVEHGGFELLFVEGLALVEPLAVVVLLETAEELQGSFGEGQGGSLLEHGEFWLCCSGPCRSWGEQLSGRVGDADGCSQGTGNFDSL